MNRLISVPILAASIVLALAGAAADTAQRSKEKRSDHWAFTPPARPEIPAVKNSAWPKNAIDHFILARLEKEGLEPSSEADRATLLRRLSLDLIGLPPTLSELDAFLADTSLDAYERQVERLLRSPHYGERWGRHWLDAARYADSDGYEKDKSRNVWFYRDWVIDAFNRDLPYNQFIVEQIAGDQLLNPTQDQIVATGFLRHSMLNEEGGVDPEQFRMEAMFDRMDAVGKSILGLTIQCAQCHDHKYDPISQEEYYRMFAYLNNDYEPMRVVYTPREQMQNDRILRGIEQIEKDLKEQTPDLDERMARWEEQIKAEEPEWIVLDPEEFGDPGGGAKFSKLEDRSMLCAGYAPTKMTTRVKTTTSLTQITAFRLEVLTHPNLPAGGPGRSFKGTFALTEFNLEIAPADHPTNKTKVVFGGASADFSQAKSPLEPNFHDRSTNNRVVGPIAFAIDGDQNTAWGIDAGPGRRNQDRKAVFTVPTKVGFPSGTILTFSIQQNHGGWNSDDHQNNLIGRLRLSVTTSELPIAADPLPRRIRDLLTIPRAERTLEQQAALFSAYRLTVPEWAEANERIEALMRQWPEGSTTLTLQAREEPRQTHLLNRGDFLQPGAAVTAGVPEFLHPLAADAAPTRLTFARWLADSNSPTTARVFVNRMWQQYFGTGLVSTPEDFGLQSEPPSHPELLDWLACEFVDRGWSIKQMHRLIVSSATYRQSSRITPDLLSKDPYNRWLARGPRIRVEGEIVRDIALAASGLLNPKIGGRSVMPPAPAFLFQPPASYAPFEWKEETGAERYRRALYTFRRRSTPYPMLQAFDVPNADFSCVRRAVSNTPLQALTTLNETLFLESARGLAVRVLREGGDTDGERLEYAFRLCVSRYPSEEERAELLAFLDRQQKRVADGWVSAWALAGGDSKEPPRLPEGIKPSEAAAWTALSRVLLNLDETVTKE